MITLDFLAVHHVIPEIWKHHQRFYKEMTKVDDYGAPQVDWLFYEHASREGRIGAAVLKDAGNLVGYAVFSYGSNQRYRDRIEANNEMLFVEKPYRAQWAAKLIRKALACHAMLGIKETNFTLNDECLGRWLSRLGAKSTYKIWSVGHGV